VYVYLVFAKREGLKSEVMGKPLRLPLRRAFERNVYES